jgi:hypothetical protein
MSAPLASERPLGEAGDQVNQRRSEGKERHEHYRETLLNHLLADLQGGETLVLGGIADGFSGLTTEDLGQQYLETDSIASESSVICQGRIAIAAIVEIRITVLDRIVDAVSVIAVCNPPTSLTSGTGSHPCGWQ